MKRIKRIFGISLIIIMLTGCMNVKSTIKINEDKSLDIGVNSQMDLVKYLTYASSFDETSSPKPTEEDIKKILDEQLNSGELNPDSMLSDEQKKEMEAEGYKIETKIDKENYLFEYIMTNI